MRLRRHEGALSPCDLPPGAYRYGAPRLGARPFERAFVLLRTIDVERELVIERNMIELAGRLIVLGAPRLAAVGRDGRAAVIADQENLGVRGVDPDDVVVTVRHVQQGEGLAAVVRYPNTIDVRAVKGARVGGVDIDAGVIERPLAQAPVVVDAVPRGAAVSRAKHTASLGLDDREDDIRVAGRDVDPDPAEHAARQAGVARDVRPMRAAVSALVQAAARPTVIQRPGCALRLPHRGIQDVRIARIHHEVDRAGLVIDEENLLPGLAAVSGLEDAAI